MKPIEEMKDFLRRLTSESIFPALKKHAKETTEPLLEKLDDVGMETARVRKALLDVQKQNSTQRASDISSIVDAIEKSKIEIPPFPEIKFPEKEITISFPGVEMIKGERGDSPTDEEITALIKPLIPEPIKGERGEKGEKGDKGDSPKKAELLELITPLIPIPMDGITPTDEELTALIKPLIPEPIPGKDGEMPEAKFENQKISFKNPDGTWKTLVDFSKILGNFMGSGGGIRDFLSLFDTPESYVGKAGKIVKVNAGETALEFGDAGSSGMSRVIVSTTGATNIASASGTDYVYLVTGAHAMSLPVASGNTNRYSIKNVHLSSITLAAQAGEFIDGTNTISIAPNDSVDLISDGTNWFII